MRRVSSIGNQLRDEASRATLISIASLQGRIFVASAPGSVNRCPREQSQDSFSLRENSVVVCDGHGTYGAQASKLVADKIVKVETWNDEELVLQVERALASSQEMDTRYSGTTAVWVRVSDDSLTVCNVGDSRAVVVGKDGQILLATRDHKPDDPQEEKRIRQSGGIVTRRRQDVARVGPLAIARSFGDFALRGLGVICNPDIYHMSKSGVSFVFLASDGVWDWQSCEQVASFIHNHKDPAQCCIDIVKACVLKWDQESHGTYCDDITAAIMYIDPDQHHHYSGSQSLL